MKTKAEQGKITVTRTVLGKEDTAEKLIIKRFETETATVGINFSRTINLNKFGLPYETMKVGVMISIPCYVEEIETIYNKVNDFGMNLLDQQVIKAENYIRSKV